MLPLIMPHACCLFVCLSGLCLCLCLCLCFCLTDDDDEDHGCDSVCACVCAVSVLVSYSQDLLSQAANSVSEMELLGSQVGSRGMCNGWAGLSV